MQDRKIQIRCKGNRYIDYNRLNEFQGNLKKISKANLKKLKSQILKHGWIAPIFVWQNGDKVEIIDGHGRLKALKELIKEGYVIDALPVVDIQAKSKKEAAEMLLSISSQYQDITEDGFSEFIKEYDLSISDLENMAIKDIDLSECMDFLPALESLEETTESIRTYQRTHILISFPPELFIHLKQHLEKILAIEGVEYEQGSN